METLLKGFQHPKDQLSAVPPEQYADRFVRFIKSSIKAKEEMNQPTKEDLAHTTIPEESPSAMPSNEKTLVSDDNVEVGRMVIHPKDRSDQELPAITIQHPSPEIRAEEFEQGIEKGTQKPLTNGWGEDYFGGKANAEVNAIRVGRELVV